MIKYRIEGDCREYRIERYDRVLARNGEDEVWREDIYWSADPANPKVHICGYGDYRFCIPLNKDTRRLIGTADKYEKFIELQEDGK